MGADQDIDFAFAGLFQDLCLLFGTAKTRQHLDTHRPVGEAIAEVVVVLLGEQRGRHQHCDLLVIFDRQEGGAHRDFGFTKAHVTAHQAIHRQRLAHIAQHRINRLRLIGRGFKRETVAEQLILFFIVLERVARFRGTLGVNIQQFCRHIADFFGGFLTRARPDITAQSV
ncbi:hypothetical protein D3C80_963420 [compost metagenome]